MKHGHRNLNILPRKFIEPLLLQHDSLQTEKENILTDRRVLTFKAKVFPLNFQLSNKVDGFNTEIGKLLSYLDYNLGFDKTRPTLVKG